MDYDYVMFESMAKRGTMGSYIGYVGIIGAALLGATFVDRVGKKRCIVVTLTTGSFVIVMHFILTIVGFSAGTINILTAVQCVAAFTNIYTIAANAMIAEQVKSDEASRGIAFSAFAMAVNGSTTVAFVLGYIVLSLNLDDYRDFSFLSMVSCAAIPVLGILTLPGKNPAAAHEGTPLLENEDTSHGESTSLKELKASKASPKKAASPKAKSGVRKTNTKK